MFVFRIVIIAALLFAVAKTDVHAERKSDRQSIIRYSSAFTPTGKFSIREMIDDLEETLFKVEVKTIPYSTKMAHIKWLWAKEGEYEETLFSIVGSSVDIVENGSITSILSDSVPELEKYKKTMYRGCNKGLGDICAHLGQIYLDGEVNWEDGNTLTFSPSWIMAKYAWDQGCSLRDANSCYLLAVALLRNEIPAVNPEVSMDFSYDACVLGVADACSRLLIVYHNLSVTGLNQSNLSRTAIRTRANVAAKRGCKSLRHAKTCLQYGRLLHEGVVVNSNLEDMREYNRLACSYGSDIGCKMVQLDIETAQLDRSIESYDKEIGRLETQLDALEELKCLMEGEKSCK